MNDIEEELKQLLELRDFGILTDEEFDEKVKILKSKGINKNEKKEEIKKEEIKKDNKKEDNKNSKEEIKKDNKDEKLIKKEDIFEWINTILKKYEFKIKINSFENEFKDGIILVAIINNYNPKLISFQKAKNNNSETNITLCYVILINLGMNTSYCSDTEFGIDLTKTHRFLSYLKIFLEEKQKNDLQNNEIHKIIAKIKQNDPDFLEVTIFEKISERTAKEIFQALEKNTKVTSLMLSGSGLNDNSSRLLGNLIKTNNIITT
jgi:hypothetical protein